MNVSAINCTPIKPQASFGSSREDNYKQALELASRMSDEYVAADDIKTPGQILASVGFAGFKTFLKGAFTFAGIDTLFKGGATSFVKSSAKKGLNLVNNAVANLEKAGATSRVKDFALKGLKNIQNKAPELASKFGNKLPFLAGIASMAFLVPAICTRDNNDDGIKDIAQKSQSAYDNFDKKTSGLMNGVSEVAQLASILS